MPMPDDSPPPEPQISKLCWNGLDFFTNSNDSYLALYDLLREWSEDVSIYDVQDQPLEPYKQVIEIRRVRYKKN